MEQLLIHGVIWMIFQKMNKVHKTDMKGERMMKDTITFRYRMSDRDVFYGGGVVNGARSITLMEDAAKRLMAKTFGNTGRCVEV